jgi:hypothetical protein
MLNCGGAQQDQARDGKDESPQENQFFRGYDIGEARIEGHGNQKGGQQLCAVKEHPHLAKHVGQVPIIFGFK